LTETIEIARDVVKKLLEAQGDSINASNALTEVGVKFDYPLVVGF
jgi:hypothetical protein